LTIEIFSRNSIRITYNKIHKTLSSTIKIIIKVQNMAKKLAKLSILIFFTSLILCSNLVYATSGDSSTLDELFPSSQDISHGFRNQEYQNLTLPQNGFTEGRSVSYTRLLDNQVRMQLHIRIYKFSGTETAYNYYNKTITEIQSNQIYDEIEIPSAFAIITFEDADVANSWFLSENLVTNVEVINDYTLEDTEEMLVYYTQLELNIIPEFQSWITIPFFIIIVIAILIKKKLTFQ
jgi:hypothetical protein